MTPTNVFLLPIPCGFPNAGKGVAAILRQTNGMFLPDTLTLEGRNRWRLWIRTEEVAA